MGTPFKVWDAALEEAHKRTEHVKILWAQIKEHEAHIDRLGKVIDTTITLTLCQDGTVHTHLLWEGKEYESDAS